MDEVSPSPLPAVRARDLAALGGVLEGALDVGLSGRCEHEAELRVHETFLSIADHLRSR
jgi:hypothetical protein